MEGIQRDIPVIYNERTRVRVRGAGMFPFARDFLCELACSPKYRRPCHRMEVTTRSRNSSSPFPHTPASGIYVPTTSHQTTFITLGYVFWVCQENDPLERTTAATCASAKKRTRPHQEESGLCKQPRERSAHTHTQTRDPRASRRKTQASQRPTQG